MESVAERSRIEPAHAPRPRAADARGPRERVAYLDNLKLLLVAMIIAGHGALAYGDLENAWPYQDVQEVQLAGVSNITLAMVVIPAAMFAMGLFFLISGLVTPGSVWRKGPRRFARDRLIRLGVPLVVWTLVKLAAAISVVTVLVRPVLPAVSGQIGQSHLWQWPQFIAMFGLGIVAAQRGWLDPVPDRIRRGCGLPPWSVP